MAVKSQAKFHERNPLACSAYSAAYRVRSPDARKKTCASYQARNPDKGRESARKWAAANKPKLAAKAAARRSMKVLSTPAWADQGAMALVYEEAARRSVAEGIEYHVDHCVPLKSKLVCGLHCDANLQVLRGKDNLSKCNRHWPDMP